MRGGESDEGERRLPFYVVVEKILGHDELLRREWPAHGTTGYDFLNLLSTEEGHIKIERKRPARAI